MKPYQHFAFFFSACCWLASNAQSQALSDSSTFVSATWKTIDLGQGVVWKNYHFNQKQLFNANQSINFLQTRLKNRKITFAFISADSAGKSQRRLIKTSQLAQAAGALAAVNGTFFDTKNAGSVDMIKIDAQVLDTTKVKVTDKRVEHQQAAIVIHKNKVSIVKGDEIGNWDRALKADNVMVTGPLLVWKGEQVTLKKTTFNDNRHPRTCACVTKKKQLILLTVDGRTDQSYGMNLHELTAVMKWLGCRDAINFDGGGSTTLWIAGQPDNGVVNYPCDNRQFDHLGERAVSNALILK